MNRERETTQEAQEAKEFHEKTTKINADALMNKFLKIATGQPIDASDDSDSSDQEESQSEHIDFANVFANLSQSKQPLKQKVSSKVPQQPKNDFGDLTPIIKDIATFKFSSINRQNEIQAMREAVQKQIRTLIASRIAENTRQVSSEIKQFYRIKEGGMRVEFSVLGRKYSMSALGEFSGDEYLCWNVAGNNVIGHIMRSDADGGFYNDSDKFEIKVTEGWKE